MCIAFLMFTVIVGVESVALLLQHSFLITTNAYEVLETPGKLLMLGTAAVFRSDSHVQYACNGSYR